MGRRGTNSKIYDKRREQLLVAATKVFSLSNFNNISVNDILREVGCSHGLFYHYFKDKNDILDAVVERTLAGLNNHIDVYASGLSGLEAIRAIITILLDILRGDNEDIIYMINFIFNCDIQSGIVEKNDKTLKKHTLHVMHLRKNIVEGQKMGNIIEGDPDDIRTCIHSLIRGLVYSRVRFGKEHFKVPSVDTVIKLLEK